MTRATDFWALGVLIHYLCKGSFINYSIFRERSFMVAGISVELADLVNQLLLFKPEERIGVASVLQIKSHPFFYNFDWNGY